MGGLRWVLSTVHRDHSLVYEHELFSCSSKKSSFENLSTPQKKIINNAIHDFRLSGIDLDIESKKIYKEGISIAKQCNDLLKETELEISELKAELDDQFGNAE